MRIKNGVNILGLAPQMVIALNVAESIYRETDHEVVITSAIDGEHMAHSHHFKGCAVDIGLHPIAEIAVRKIGESLGQQFQVILEKDHIHIEFDPKI